MTEAEFQAAHGAHWAQIVAHPSFFAAMQVCGSRRLKEIENLTVGQIEASGRVHLANFQGHLQTEAILLGLAIESQDGDFDIPQGDYGVQDQVETDLNAERQSTIFPEFTPLKPKPKSPRKKKKSP